MAKTKKIPPDPYLFIKSIAEQGYSLSTALADLIDNSITAEATRVELLYTISDTPFELFIADNGKGMDENELENNMRFPSRDSELFREENDLGRFGLGMKTASFSQTRWLTVISRRRSGKYAARTWSVEHLKNGEWEVIINTKEDIDDIIKRMNFLQSSHLSNDSSFEPNTIIYWKGLYKYESQKNRSMDDQRDSIRIEMKEEVEDHLSLVFHKFLEKKFGDFSIRINNNLVKPFSPFPELDDVRKLLPIYKEYNNELITIQGYILPSRSMKESREGLSIWTFGKRSLTDMEGIYVYRKNRLIIYGGWNRLVKKSPHFQLGRLMVEIGTNADALFQLNVSKSSIKTPFEIRQAFLRSVATIKIEAVNEYRRGINRILKDRNAGVQAFIPMLKTEITGQGEKITLNPEFPLIDEIFLRLDAEGKRVFKQLIKKMNLLINDISGADQDIVDTSEEINEALQEDLQHLFEIWSKRNLSKEEMLKKFCSIYGRKEEQKIISDFLLNK